MKPKREPEAISARTGSPVTTVFTPGRCFAVLAKLIATASAKRERNSTARPGIVFASWRQILTLRLRAASTGGSDE